MFTVSARLSRALRRAAVLFALAAIPPAFSQPQVGEGSLPAFEYASVLPSHPAAGPVLTVSPSSGEFSAIGVSLKQLIGFAYDVDPSRVIGGPDWVQTARYQVEARPARSFNTDGSRVTTNEIRPLVLGLLLDHFGLQAHREQTDLDFVVIDDVGAQPVHDPEGGVFELVRPAQ